MSNPNSPENNKLKAEASGKRATRNARAATNATKKTAAANAAKSAARKAAVKTGAKVASRAVPGVGAAMTAIEVGKAVGGKGNKPTRSTVSRKDRMKKK
jgi:hypothetical protein